MTNRSSAPRMLAAALMLLIGLGSAASRLPAQEATANPGVGQGALAPVSADPATASGTVAAPAVASEAGPRIVPPLQQYQPSLPHRDGDEHAAMASSGGSHTVVLSTLALVLIVVIVVLLAVD